MVVVLWTPKPTRLEISSSNNTTIPKTKERTFFMIKPQLNKCSIFHQKSHGVDGVQQLQELTEVGTAEHNYDQCVEYDSICRSAIL